MKDIGSMARTHRTSATIAVASLALTLAACGQCTDDDGDTQGSDVASHEWDFYTFVGASHPATVASQEFADQVTEETDGEVTVTVRPVGELPIAANEALQALRNGEIQIADAYVGFITGDTTFSGVLGLPFLATTNEEGNQAIEALREDIDAEFAEFGAELLYTYDWNMQVITGAGDPVTSPDEIAGIKARSSSPQQTAFLEQLGAHPATLTSEEVPSGMNTGVIDAVLTAPMNIVGSGWEDFIDWAYLAGINPGISFIVVSEDAMNGVSEESQQVIRDLSEEYNSSVSGRLHAENDTALAQLEGEGKTITEPSDADIQQLRDQMSPYWQQWASENDAEDMLQQVTEALGI